jgi:creatinine amidohydrolase
MFAEVSQADVLPIRRRGGVTVTELLTGATSRDVADRAAEVAVLPVGSFEQHGDHLPLITDTVVASVVARRVSEAYDLFLLPPLTVSCSHEHARWRGTVSISATTLYAVVHDIRESLRRSGVRTLVLVNGHGGNHVLRNVVQEASVAGPEMGVFPSRSDWESARAAGGLATSGHDDMHAGELETSILLYAAPELVRRGATDVAVPERPHLLSLGMSAYTSSGVIGRPSLGTADKGRAVVASLVGSFGELLAAVTTGR